MIVVYGWVSFLSFLFYRYTIYFQVIRDCYEALAIAAFFTLLCTYLEPTVHEQKNYFRAITPKNWVLPINWFQRCSGGEHKGAFRKPTSGLTWFNVCAVASRTGLLMLTQDRSSGSACTSIAAFSSS